MAIHTLTLPDWRPPSKNELFRRKLKTRMRLQKQAAELVASYALAQGIPKATGPRKVTVRFTYPAHKRWHDCDAFHASLLDCLVAAGLLLGDRPHQVRLGVWAFQLGERQTTTIRLRDLEELP